MTPTFADEWWLDRPFTRPEKWWQDTTYMVAMHVPNGPEPEATAEFIRQGGYAVPFTPLTFAAAGGATGPARLRGPAQRRG